MKRHLTTLLLQIIIFNCFSQAEFKEYKGKHFEDLKYFGFKNCKINYKSTTEFSMFGQNYVFDKFKISSRIPVQIRESYLGDKNKFAKRKTEYLLYTRNDTNCVFLDTILLRLRNDLTLAAEWNKKHNQPIDDFSNNSFHGILRGWACGVFFYKDMYIPYIMTPHENTGAFYILWLDKKIFYLELKSRTRGLGSMSSFIRNSIAFKVNDDYCSFNSVTSISMVTEIINEIKAKYTR